MSSSPCLSRADLVRCLQKLGPDQLNRWLPTFCFELEPETRVSAEKDDLQLKIEKKMTADQVDSSILGSALVPPQYFWRVIAFKEKKKIEEIPQWFLDASTIKDGEVRSNTNVAPPPARPLVAWSRLWPLLRKVIGRRTFQGKLDISRAVELCAQGKAMFPLPEEVRLTWANNAQIWVDRRLQLAPFWPDFGQVVEGLMALRGKHGLELIQMDQGILGPVRRWGQYGMVPRVLDLATSHQVVLVIGDLGRYDKDSENRRAWTRWGRRLRASGIQATALVPCPPRLWISEPDDPWNVIFWDRGIKLYAKPRHLPPPSSESHGVDSLITLLSPAVLVEPALLRAVRFCLPTTWADVGSEYQLWWHRDMVAHVQAVNLKPELAAKWRGAFCLQSFAQQVADLIMSYHCNRSPFIQEEERLVCRQLLGKDYLESPLMECVSKTFGPGWVRFPGLYPWFRRLSSRLHPSMWENPRLASAYVRAFPNAALPVGLNPAKVAWALPNMPQNHILRVLGKYWVVGGNQGSPLLEVRSGTGYIEVEQEGQKKSFSLADEYISPDLDGKDNLTLNTDIAAWTLERIPRPSWAGSMGRDPHGLFVTWRDRKFYWHNPGELSLGPDLPALRVEHGRWLDEAQYLAWAQVGIACPEGAQHMGLDEFGVYADFTYKNVSWRMRLILPDRFMMGSPEDEPERYSPELLHEVLLSQAYWLAETTCTQALWQAVMGQNPSQFKGPEHPVDTVSWNDAGDFLAKLPKDYAMRLPSEAEWEYACRAGTQTPFSFGSQLDWHQVNFDANYPYHDQAKGEYRQQTLAVKDLPPNPWGLYQMHGNIWEWCEDWYADYDPSMLVDPRGPAAGASRVLRGGGWFDVGRGVRAAYRGSLGPGGRNQYMGFRLARGQNSKPLKQKKIERRTVEQPRDEGGETVRSGAGNT